MTNTNIELAKGFLQEADQYKKRFRYWGNLIRNAYDLGFNQIGDQIYQAGRNIVLGKKISTDILADHLKKGTGSLTAKKAKNAWQTNKVLFNAHCFQYHKEQTGKGRRFVMEIARADNFDYQTYRALDSIRRYFHHSGQSYSVQYTLDGKNYAVHLFPRKVTGGQAVHHQRQYVIPATYNTQTMFITFCYTESNFYGKAKDDYVNGFYEDRVYPPALHTA